MSVEYSDEEIDLRRRQITALITAYYEKHEFLRETPFDILLQKAFDKYLYTDLTIEEINEKLMDEIVRRLRDRIDRYEKDSIRMNGLLEPLLVRPDKSGGYELISGHRRKLALELCGIKEADCYIENLSDDEAIIKMVDSNIYRNLILPSEKAFAYKMKLEAIKHQGKKNKLLHKVWRSRFRYP